MLERKSSSIKICFFVCQFHIHFHQFDRFNESVKEYIKADICIKASNLGRKNYYVNVRENAVN